jgi:lipopolysaccharide export LptBFGC system permease protein LptF
MSSQIQMLSNKFNSLLTQYKETYDEFLNTIGSNDNSFKSLPGAAFISGNNINTLQGSNVDNCMISCSKNQSCSGATFDNQRKTCLLSSGMGNIINSPNQTAIIKQALYYTYQLEKINDELTNINKNMMTLVNSRMDDYQETKKLNAKKSEILQHNYKILQQERMQIEDIIKQYETLNSAYEDESINTTSHYYIYVTYLLIIVFLVMLLLRYSLPAGQVGGGMTFSKISPIIFVILGVIIIVNAMLKN